MQNVRWWDAAAVAVAVVIAAVSLLDPPFGADDIGVWAVAGAFLLVHLAWGRRCVPVATTRAHLAVSITYAVLLAVGTAIEPSFAILQAFLYPFVWSTSPSTRSAIIANLAIAVAIVFGYAARSGPAGLVTGSAIAALSVGFSIALGLWITRIAQFGEERARLLEELQAAQGQLAAMHRDAGVADERARLAREIHDTIAQSLTGMVMVAQRTERRLAGVDGEAAASARGDVELMEQMAREALTEARGLVASLAPIESDGGLGEALRRLAATFERETGVRVSVTTDAAGLDRELEVVLLRCAQEALANVRKHARANVAEIVVTTAGVPPEIVLAVRDDGVGPGDAVPGDGGFGLVGMRDRVSLVGGRLEFGAGRDGGTVLRVVVPSRRAEERRDATAGADA
ncbi:sensor histidine kinase [Agromyces binzhouensis]|uniref:Sensor histidine kinase n=1 Tax=Agromyces binzhouensis TaxID=1817495 RepID=A0A4Q2JDK6_9MICO|nr:sensor histidine kinase [Agromyces binzhouensis]RXZ45771.1 sensor histidine kinase [Agromyces binzhouensis]